jgi:hypothetical protein
MDGEDKSNREPSRIRTFAVDLQYLRYAVAAADHGSFRRAADALLLRQGPHSTRCPLRHLKTKLICPRGRPKIQVDRGIRNGVFRDLPAASGGAWKGRQMAAMPEGVSSLTAGISKENPGLLGQALLHQAVSNDEPVDMNPKQDRSSSRQFLRSHISEAPRYPVFLASVGCLSPEGLVHEARSCARS